MPQGIYLPEGMLIETAQNKLYTASHTGMERAMTEGKILEGHVVMCDAGHNLTVDINGMTGVIAKNEGAVGIESGKTREIAIISRVGKPVCFKVMGYNGGRYILSRRAAQQEALDYFMDNLKPGSIIRAKVSHIETFGAFVDIGCGNISLIGIENISVSRISHPRERFYPKQEIYAVVTALEPENQRIWLSHRELLGTWEQNAAKLAMGETVEGIIRGVEEYGIFVELTPNLSGLAEKREGLSIGDSVSVYIKSIIPDRMKIKLVIIDWLEHKARGGVCDSDYYINGDCIKSWRYTPPECQSKIIESIF